MIPLRDVLEYDALSRATVRWIDWSRCARLGGRVEEDFSILDVAVGEGAELGGEA